MAYTNEEVNNMMHSVRALQNTAFKSMTRSSRSLPEDLLDNMGASTLNGDSLRPVTTDIKMVSSDHDFVSTFGIPMVTGRYFPGIWNRYCKLRDQ